MSPNEVARSHGTSRTWSPCWLACITCLVLLAGVANTAHAQRRAQHVKRAQAWECRAADGEVFYRLSRCPASIAGDGVVRGDGDYTTGKRRRGGAWGRIHVHGTRIERSEACEHIDAVTADSRDGHQHDERVSTYDHLMGRDPCGSP